MLNVFEYGTYNFNDNCTIECLSSGDIDVLLPSRKDSMNVDDFIIIRCDLVPTYFDYNDNSSVGNTLTAINTYYTVSEALSEETGHTFVTLVYIVNGSVRIAIGQVVSGNNNAYYRLGKISEKNEGFVGMIKASDGEFVVDIYE